MKKILISTSLCMVLAGSLVANDKNQYAGFSYGQGKANTNVNAITASLDEKDNGYKIFGGYKFNKYFSTELFYTDLGSASLSGNNGDTFSYEGSTYQFIANSASLTFDAKTIGLAGVASYPLHKYFEPFVKIGLHRYDLKATVSGTNFSASESDTGTDIVYGLGFNIPINESFDIKTEYEKYNLDEYNDTRFLSVGIAYKF